MGCIWRNSCSWICIEYWMWEIVVHFFSSSFILSFLQCFMNIWFVIWCSFSGVFKNILRMQAFRTMGRLTFGAYLIHPSVIRLSYGSTRHPIFSDDFRVVNSYQHFGANILLFVYMFSLSLLHWEHLLWIFIHLKLFNYLIHLPWFFLFHSMTTQCLHS